MKGPVLRFTCTQCGKCCNRSPEVELSEAAALADVFVFRLMFRLYWLPVRFADLEPSGEEPARSSTTFFERKRLLSAFAARKYPVKARRDGKRVEYTKYLVISALALDTVQGACSALRNKRCGIYDRRPLSCRSVPLHYSRPLALAESDLKGFAGTDGYECDTSDNAAVILNDGHIAVPEIASSRSEALNLVRSDRTWSEAILRRMHSAASFEQSLPSLQEIEANAHVGAMTTSMRVAWQVAVDVALITQDEYDRLLRVQLNTIRRELARSEGSADELQTLREMDLEYREHLSGGRHISGKA